MTLQKQLGFWLAAFLVVVLLIYVLADVLLPFVAGLALAYLLDPLASRLERMGMSRLVATVGILSMFVLLFVLALVLLAPVLVQQLGAFMARVPQYLTQLQAIISERGAPLLERLGMGSVAGAGLQDAQKSCSAISPGRQRPGPRGLARRRSPAGRPSQASSRCW
jgi:predicted PurR-regulated permease PerM